MAELLKTLLDWLTRQETNTVVLLSLLIAVMWGLHINIPEVLEHYETRDKEMRQVFSDAMTNQGELFIQARKMFSDECEKQRVHDQQQNDLLREDYRELMLKLLSSVGRIEKSAAEAASSERGP